MDEENKQVTADEVYSYGESTEESAGEPEEKAEPEPEATGSEDSQDNKFVYQDNQYDYSQQHSRNRNEQSDNSPMDLKDWILTLIVLLNPCVGIVMYFVWAFESNGSYSQYYWEFIWCCLCCSAWLHLARWWAIKFVWDLIY